MAGRKPTTPSSVLGVALRARREGLTLHQAQAECGVEASTLARIERGESMPTARSALALARWLGWTVERVIEAADAPTDGSEGPG